MWHVPISQSKIFPAPSLNVMSKYNIDSSTLYWKTRPGAHLASYTMDTKSLPWGIRLGHGVDNPPPSTKKVKERNLYSPSVPSWPVLWCPLPLQCTETLGPWLTVHLISGEHCTACHHMTWSSEEWCRLFNKIMSF